MRWSRHGTPSSNCSAPERAARLAGMKLLVALLALLGGSGQPADRPGYAAGQVWEYRTRPVEPRSLLKIQAIEADPRGDPIYHVSLVDLAIAGGEVQHLPVSRRTLDASVTAARPGASRISPIPPRASRRGARRGAASSPFRSPGSSTCSTRRSARGKRSIARGTRDRLSYHCIQRSFSIFADHDRQRDLLARRSRSAGGFARIA